MYQRISAHFRIKFTQNKDQVLSYQDELGTPTG